MVLLKGVTSEFYCCINEDLTISDLRQAISNQLRVPVTMINLADLKKKILIDKKYEKEQIRNASKKF